MRLYKFLVISLLALGTILSTNSCNDDETPGGGAIRGCTDDTADNYNPNAEEDDGSCVFSGCTDEQAENYDAQASNDDGSCVFARDKFFGLYVGSFLCMDPLLSPIANSDSLEFELKEPVDPEDKSKVILGLDLAGFPVDLEGSVDGNDFILNDTLLGAPIPVPLLGTVNADIIGNGTATLSDDGQIISGLLDLNIVFENPPFPLPASIDDSCDLVGVKQ